MVGPDTDLNDFPPWIWPYIHVARLADFHKEAERFKVSGTVRSPEAAINAHVIAIMSAISVKKVVAGLKLKDSELQRQFEAAASQALTVAIDDCGNGRPKPWPIPPRHIQLAEIAGRLAIAAAELEADAVMRDDLRDAASRLSDQAGLK